MAQISVLMPAYNGEKFLPEALKSISSQTFSDIEILICDDCSTDSTPEILSRAAAADRRIKIFRNEKNSGVTYSLNRLLSEASAPLCARMDADDAALPDRLQKQYDFMIQHPEIAVAGGNLEIINEDSETIGRRVYPASFADIKRNMLCQNPLAHPAVIMRTEVVRSLGGYLEQPGCEDYYLWLRCIEKGFQVGNLPDVLLRYRLSANQIKQRNMKKSLFFTMALQRRYIFKRGFFSLKALFYLTAEHFLLLLPNKLLLKLFARVTYQ